MSKVLDRILSDYRSHLFEQKQGLKWLIDALKMRLWHGPGAAENDLKWSEGLERLREMLDDVDELWVNEDREEWSTQNPNDLEPPDGCPEDYVEDGWVQVSDKMVWRAILGELYEYV